MKVIKRRTKLGDLTKTLIYKLFGENVTNERTVVVNTNSEVNSVYDYRGPRTVDYSFVRKLYRNRLQDYALGGQLTKPIIDTCVSFIGMPEVRSVNDKTVKAIEEFKQVLPFHTVHRVAEREGDAFVWPQWDDKNKNLKFVLIPGETIKRIYIDPITKEVIGYKIEEEVQYANEKNDNQRMKITLYINKDRIRRVITESTDNMNGEKTIMNRFGFIPIIQFTNDKEPWELRGHSELENIEPQIKLYHDITLEAMHAQKRDGHPKAKVKTRNVQSWIDTNFGDGAFEQLKAGAKISLKDKDLYVCKTGLNGGEDEDISYIEANKTTGDYSVMSELSFTNIVEGSQTPELVFGANMGTSLASVREQRPGYIKKIEKKQLQYDESWRKLIVAALIIKGFATFETYKNNDFNLSWPTPDFASEKEKAETLNYMSTSLIKMKNGHLIGDEAIHKTVKKFEILDIEQDYEKHAKDIEGTAELMVKRKKDETAAQDNNMNQRIATGEYENGDEADAPETEDRD